MKRLNKGPELKMPDLKVPDFAKDVFYDLHDRRLLAPLALVVVAIAAVPFLLGGGSEDSARPPATGAAAPAGEAESTSFTVVEAKPGLREYRKRLAGREPTNPFKQRFAGPKGDGAEPKEGTDESSSAPAKAASSSAETTIEGGSGSPSSTAPSSTPPSNTPSSTPPSNTPSSSTPSSSTPPPDTGGGGEHHLTFYAWGIDVQITKSDRDGATSDESRQALVRDDVLPQTSLPGPKAPVLTYMGLSRKAAAKKSQKVLLLVSSDVSEISGDRTCGSNTSTEICELIEVKPGSPVTFVYGANEVRYTIKVLSVKMVVTGHG